MFPTKGFQDAIMVITEVHLDIVKKSVGLTAPPKNVQVGIIKDENTGKCTKVSDEKTLTQIKSIAKSTGNSQDQTDVFTTKELNIFSNRTCQGFSGCLKGP